MTLLERPGASGQQRGRWGLSAVATEAFADQPQSKAQWGVARRPLLRLMLLLSLWVSEVRVHPSGAALCLLSRSSSRGRVRGVALAVAGLITLSWLVVLVPWVFWLVVVMLTVLVLPQLRTSTRARPGRRRLAAAVPAGPYVGVHTVASVVPGAGRELIRTVNAEADARGWVLILDAANESLADYYADLGYLTLTEPVLMPWGEQTVRMMRKPDPQLRRL